MKSELLGERPPASATAGETIGRRWEQSFDLAPGRPTPLADRGARHLFWSLAEMLRPVVLDARALAQRPLTVLLIGCDEGYLGHRLLEWGVDRVLAAESRPEVLERALSVRADLGIDPRRLDLRACATPEQLHLERAQRFDFAIVDERAGCLGARAEALETAAAHCAQCALITPDRLVGATGLRAAGFGKPRLLEPPADAERRLIAFELNLMLARPEPGDAEPTAEDADDQGLASAPSSLAGAAE